MGPHPSHIMNMSSLRASLFPRVLLTAALALLTGAAKLSAQTPASEPLPGRDEVLELSPFVVDSTDDRGYQATNTLAGTRIRTDLADVGSSISVITAEMLQDLGAKNNETVLSYAVNTEVGGPRGNFSGGVKSGTYQEQDLFVNPNGNTRVRGLTSADNTRNYFLSDIPWDGYTVSRVDIQRGPNAILFGLGSPAGVVNATTNSAMLNKSSGTVEAQFDEYGSQRYTGDYNVVLIPKELALRVAAVRDHQKFQQKPAFSEDERIYGALKYAPGFLNRGRNTFAISGNYEHGSIESNRPRIVPPQDNFSGFWDPESAGGTGKKTYNFLTQDLGTEGSPDYTQVLGGAGLGDFIQVINSKGNYAWEKMGVDAYRGLRPDGTTIETLNGDEFGPWPRSNAYGPVGIRDYNDWAAVTGLPFGSFGAYAPKVITDPSVYDFYHRLLDGPNKREFSDWDVFDVSVSQTFLDNAIGYDVSYFNQRLKRSQWSALGWNNQIYMDLNDVRGDTTTNPDVGRGYVQVEHRNGGNGSQTSDRNAVRAQVFGEYDFGKKREGLWARILGLHRLTGLVSKENQKQDQRTYRYMQLDTPSLAQFTPDPFIGGTENALSPGYRYYLSDDMRGRSSAAGSSLSNMDMAFLPNEGGNVSIRRFDNTWTATGVDPAAPWVNPYDPDTEYTQSNNPANYRGWTNTNARIVTIHSKDGVGNLSARDYLTETGQLSEFDVKSKTAVWQGYFWDRAIIGTYGWRKDEARSYIFESSDRSHNAVPATMSADLSPGTYNFSNPNGTYTNLDTITRNWSVAAHLNRLLGKRDFLPINVSLYYNQGENFQPLAGRIDAFAQPLAAPEGKTKEISALLATKDNKYSVRITRYDTEVKNGNSTGSIGNMWALEQTLEFTGNLARDFRSGRSGTGNYADAGGDVAALQNVYLPAWFQFEKDFVAKFPVFTQAWMGSGTPFGTDGNGNIIARAPAGFAFTEDSHSKGYEIEFTANPTPNWRIAVNASKTGAVRTNVPGAAFSEVAAYLDNAMQNTNAGLAPVWWDGNTFGGRNVGPYTVFRPDYLQINALNGQSAGEVREWRANFITNYTFSTGALKGVGVGGGYRWEDSAIIAYAPMLTAAGDNAVNLSAPYRTPSQSTVDLWLSYERKLTDRVNWKIQLNVYNAFGKNELVPFSASVDYAALGSTPITPDTVIPMKASGFTIREGTTWTISNTFSF